MKKLSLRHATMLCTGLTIGLMAVVFVGDVQDANAKHQQPHGLVTGKYWNSAFWKDGVLVDPADYCLEIDYRMNTCVEESVYYKYDQGMMYP